MKLIKSDIKILDHLFALNLNVSLWSARRKMTAEDFGGVELPPDDLATLGSKRIADPERIKIFTTLKARAFSFLDRHGVRFMSGWAIPEEKADMITDELVRIKTLFFNARDEFLADYEKSLDSWLSRHKTWSNIIRNSLVSADYVRARLDFRWQLYKVAPTDKKGSESGLESGLAEEVTGLAGTLFNEVARSADEIWRKVYLGKTEVTHKALSPLKTLYGKLKGLTFIEPHVAPVAEVIEAAINRMPAKGNIQGTDLILLQGLVCLLKDSDSLIHHSQKLIDGYGPATVLDALLEAPSNQSVMDLDNLSSEISEEEPEIPVLCETLNGNKTIITSMGLW